MLVMDRKIPLMSFLQNLDKNVLNIFFLISHLDFRDLVHSEITKNCVNFILHDVGSLYLAHKIATFCHFSGHIVKINMVSLIKTLHVL